MHTRLLPLTICIITNRSDVRFLHAFQSAQIATEVLIVDNHSQNDWAKLLRTYRGRVIEWDDAPISDFAAVRNQALAHANHEWVLFLDSDEVLPTDQQDRLAQLLQDTTAAGYWITRKDIFRGQPVNHGEGTIKLIRLLRKSQAKFTGTVHEIATVSGTVAESQLVIDHYAHDSITSFLNKVQRYAQLAATQKSHTFWKNVWELCCYPPGKFIWNYVWKQGFRDGWAGLVYAILMSLHSFFVRIYRYEHAISHADN